MTNDSNMNQNPFQNSSGMPFPSPMLFPFSMLFPFWGMQVQMMSFQMWQALFQNLMKMNSDAIGNQALNWQAPDIQKLFNPAQNSMLPNSQAPDRLMQNQMMQNGQMQSGQIQSGQIQSSFPIPGLNLSNATLQRLMQMDFSPRQLAHLQKALDRFFEAQYRTNK